MLGQTFKNPKPGLLERLRESGPVPGETNGVKARDENKQKKKRPDKGVRLHLAFSDLRAESNAM